MSWNEITSGDKVYVNLKEQSKGDVLVTGTFLKEGVSRKYQNKQYDFQCEETGKIVVLNGNADLKYKMDFIKVGDRIQIIYDGQEECTGGPNKGAQMHRFRLLKDDSQSSDDASTEQVDEEDDDFDL